MQSKTYKANNFTVKAIPMTKWDYAILSNEVVVPAWKYWDGFQIDWNGYKFWQDERSFHEQWTEIVQPTRAAVIVKIEEYHIDDISNMCEDDWSNEECKDAIEEIARDWDPDESCRQHIQVTII